MGIISARSCMAAIRSVLLAVTLGGLTACSAPFSSPSAQQTPSSPPGTAGVGTPTVVPRTGPFSLNFTTQYTVNTCDASQAANSICVSTAGMGQGANNGHGLTAVGLQQTSAYAPGDGSDCAPATTTGTLRLAQGDTATFTGTGTFCRALQTATFTYTITGGTGAYTHASGAGTIHVPPPSSSSDDTETWSGTLVAGA
jgi:hypothetical protein